MKILGCVIDEMQNYANDPRMTVIVDELPFQKEPKVWKLHRIWGGKTVTCEDGPFVLFHSIGNENEQGMRGYGGAKMIFNIDDGSVIESTNVWSSRASVAAIAIKEPLKDVSILVEGERVAHSTYGLKMPEFISLMKEAGYEFEIKNREDEEVVTIIKPKRELKNEIE